MTIEELLKHDDPAKLAREAANIVYMWAKSDSAAHLPPDVSLSIGIVIGRLSKLEKERR